MIIQHIKDGMNGLRTTAIEVMVECFINTQSKNNKLNIAYTLYNELDSREIASIEITTQRELYKYAMELREKIYRTDMKNKKNVQERRHQKEQDYSLTYEEWEDTLEHFNNSCVYCGSRGHMTYEHFIPFSKGGPFTQGNIIPACQFCNSSKNNKAFKKWYPTQAFYNKDKESKILNFIAINN